MSPSHPVIILEEHYESPAYRSSPAYFDLSKVMPGPPTADSPTTLLGDVGPDRIRRMDEAGVDIMVLSHVGFNYDLAPPDLVRQINDHLASEVSSSDGRYKAFGYLPMCHPQDACSELRRCVTELGMVEVMIHGMIGQVAPKFLDQPEFESFWAVAAQLDVPVYLHPSYAPPQVAEIYYNLDPSTQKHARPVDFLLGMAGWGWHSETALHLCRVILSGILDRHPGLQIIVGHQGEMLPSMWDRQDRIFQPGLTGLQKTWKEYMTQNVHITAAGVFQPSVWDLCKETFGVERMMFSVDYPFGKLDQGTKHLESLEVEEEIRWAYQGGNAKRLLKL